MRFNTLDDWLGWQESLHLSAIDLGLERVGIVAKRMGLIADAPADAVSGKLCFAGANRQPRVITVAGTNGKGSCIAALQALLSSSGLTTGSYTSPHFLHYCERICIDGEPVSEAEVCRAFAAIDQARGEISLTYFEFGTLAALEVFRRHCVDVVLLEVGLGGRLDAVNIIDADVAVVTSIALDHQDWLGSDREVIGREKSGIARAGKALICTDANPPSSIATYAAEVGADLQQWGRAFEVDTKTHTFDLSSAALSLRNLPLPSLPLPSVVAALLACQHLGIELVETELADVLGKLSLPGRFQRFECRGREVILDVAHNPAASQLLAERLVQLPPAPKTTALFAIMADKDIAAVIEPLQAVVDHWLLAPLPNNSRAASVEQVQGHLRGAGSSVASAHSVAGAVELFLSSADEGERLLVLGSFFTVAAALEVLERELNDG